MKIKELSLAALVLSVIGCSTPPKISPERSYEEQVENMSFEQVIRAIKTPEQAQKYLMNFLESKLDSEIYDIEDYIASFKKTHKIRKGDCEDGAIAAAALLSDNGYLPLLLRMYVHFPLFSSIGFSHGIYVYKENNLWGSLGINEGDYRRPKFETLDELVASHKYFMYSVVNLNKLYPRWIEKDIKDGEKIYEGKLEYIKIKNKE